MSRQDEVPGFRQRGYRRGNQEQFEGR
jgi:hypothetical protein